MEVAAALQGLGMSADARRVGRYELHYRIANGGMGAVYLARPRGDASLARWVALKVIHAHTQDDPQFVAMFLDEARITALLDHPNVCRVIDFGEADGIWFLAMEYLQGESLATLAKTAQGPAPPAIAARIVADAARGLHAAHELKGPDGQPANVVHRDVTPANVFVRYDGITKVLDFGIAKARTRIAAKTRAGTVKGNFAYVAPESFRQADVDRRADVYGLGVILWELSTGRRLFTGGPVEIMSSVLKGAPKPSTVVPGYPPELEALVMRALARDPAERFATAEQLARDLDRWIAQSGTYAAQGEVAEHLRGLFAARIAMRETLLQAPVHELPADAPIGAPAFDPATLGDDATVADASLPLLTAIAAAEAQHKTPGASALPAKSDLGLDAEREAFLKSVKLTDDAATMLYNPKGTARPPTPRAVPQRPDLRNAPAAPHVPTLKEPGNAAKPAPHDAATPPPKPAAEPVDIGLQKPTAQTFSGKLPDGTKGLRASALFDFTYDDLRKQHEGAQQKTATEAPEIVRPSTPISLEGRTGTAPKLVAPVISAAPTTTAPKGSRAKLLVALVVLLALAGAVAAALLLRR